MPIGWDHSSFVPTVKVSTAPAVLQIPKLIVKGEVSNRVSVRKHPAVVTVVNRQGRNSARLADFAGFGQLRLA